jgi:hypothetical protein
MTYFSKIKSTTDRLISTLESKGVESRYLKFDEIEPEILKARAPTDARSEFLANRAMGDWAEDILSRAINKSLKGKKVIQYGDTDKIAAGEDGFSEFYRTRLNDVRIYGKRPDLLVFDKSVDCANDLSSLKTKDLIQTVKKADFSIEVRSSKFEAIRYMDVRKQEKESGKNGGRDTPSFTVKVEDLKIVYRWLKNHDIPQIYCQVFFDSIFAINFLDIFRIISSGSGFLIENPKKSQEKSTIMIPITKGIKIASCSLPDFEVEHKVTRLGRHDAYVRPVGGEANLDHAALVAAAASAAA